MQTDLQSSQAKRHSRHHQEVTEIDNSIQRTLRSHVSMLEVERGGGQQPQGDPLGKQHIRGVHGPGVIQVPVRIVENQGQRVIPAQETVIIPVIPHDRAGMFHDRTVMKAAKNVIPEIPTANDQALNEPSVLPDH